MYYVKTFLFNCIHTKGLIDMKFLWLKTLLDIVSKNRQLVANCYLGDVVSVWQMD